MSVLRLIRSMLFTWMTFIFLFSICPHPSLKNPNLKWKWLSCAIWTILWIGNYTWVFSRVPDILTHDIGNYYLLPCLFFASSIIYITCLSRLRKPYRLLLSIFYSSFIFILLLSSLFYIIYFIIYGQVFDEYALLSVIATNPDEIVNYLTSTFSIWQIFLLIASLTILFLSISINTIYITRQPYAITLNKSVIICSIVIFYFFFYYLCTVFPTDQFLHLRRLNGPMNAFIQLQKNIDKNADGLIVSSPDGLSSSKTPGTIIMVIGESANRDMMSSFNPQYTQNTTPWELSKRDDNNFYFFDKAYANFPNTVMAVTQALTSSNQYNDIPLKDSVDILDVAKQAGYQTYWLSMQNKSTVSDAGITIIANRADSTNWLHGYDEDVLQSLTSINPNENNFIIIHLNGSHFRYDRRVPEVFIEKYNLPISTKEEQYNASLQYTDCVLQQIYDYGKKNLHLQAMIYFSDHGENMRYTHTASPFYFDMVHIPLWIYLSPQYQAAYPNTKENLFLHQKGIFTNDLIFESVSGILHAPSNYYKSCYDITSPDYNLSIKDALTLHGKKHISEDIQQ